MKDREEIEWGARVFADKTIKEAVRKEIEKLAFVLLGNFKLKITLEKEGFVTSGESGLEVMRYKGQWSNWTVYGHTKTDMYLQVIKLLANDNSRYFPIVSYRTEDEWVNKMDYDKMKKQLKEANNELEELKNKSFKHPVIPPIPTPPIPQLPKAPDGF